MYGGDLQGTLPYATALQNCGWCSHPIIDGVRSGAIPQSLLTNEFRNSHQLARQQVSMMRIIVNLRNQEATGIGICVIRIARKRKAAGLELLWTRTFRPRELCYTSYAIAMPQTFFEYISNSVPNACMPLIKMHLLPLQKVRKSNITTTVSISLARLLIQTPSPIQFLSVHYTSHISFRLPTQCTQSICLHVGQKGGTTEESSKPNSGSLVRGASAAGRRSGITGA